MSVFNSIIINCPNFNSEVEFQTKSGSHLTSEYHIKSVSKEEIMGDRYYQLLHLNQKQD